MSFNSLPFELRSAIWTLAVEPRRITNIRIIKHPGNFRKKHRNKGLDIKCEATATPAPVLMHICHESRQLAPYQRAFTGGTEPRWTWVNFEIDVFCVTSLWYLDRLASHYSEIRQLRIQTDDHNDWYEEAMTYSAVSALYNFTNIKDIQIVLGRGDEMWADVYTQYGFEYRPWKMTFLDQGSGLVLTGEQLNLVFEWQLLFTFDREGNPPDPDRLSEEIEWAHDSFSHLTMAQMYEIEGDYSSPPEPCVKFER